jgi:hypothetical protein
VYNKLHAVIEIEKIRIPKESSTTAKLKMLQAGFD